MKTYRPRIALLHYTAPPTAGGVESVIAQHARLFTSAGYPTVVVAGRGAPSGLRGSAETVIVPEAGTDYPENQVVAAASEQGPASSAFLMLQDRIEKALGRVLAGVDIVIAHDVMTMHFNLPLTAALHRLVDQGTVQRLIVWCHDLSHYVQPASRIPMRFGFPWDLLRTYRPEFTYVAVSSRRQRLLAQVLGCSPQQIQVVSNGVDPSVLLGLSGLGEHLANEFGLLAADLVILMPVRIARARNIEYALHVVAALKTAGVRPRLIVTGPPDPHVPDAASCYARIKVLRRTLALENEVILLHEGTSRYRRPLALEPPVIAEVYRLCDLVFVPGHSEGFGMPVLEAGFLDRPVFTTRVPVVDDLGEEFEHLIRANERPEAVAARIRNWSEKDIRHRLRRRFRKTHTWAAIFSQAIEPLIMEAAVSPEGRAV